MRTKEDLLKVLTQSTNWWKEKGKSLYFFNKVILGHTDMNVQLHKKLCDKIQAWEKSGPIDALIMMARGHLKSSVVTVGYSLHQIAYPRKKWKEHRILIANATLENAKLFLQKIKLQLTNNELFGILYTDSLPKDKDDVLTWGSESIQWIGSDGIVRVVDVKSYKQGISSRHYDLIIVDDLVNEKNMASVAELEKVMTWYGNLDSVLEPDGSIITIGTPWNQADLYAYLEEVGVEQLVKIPVFKTDESGKIIKDSDGKPIPVFPEKFTLQRLNRIKIRQGPYLFSSQYLLNPFDDDAVVFRKEWLQYEYGTVGENMNYFMAVDPARTTKVNSDYTAFVIIGVDVNNNIHLIVAERGKLEPMDIFEKILQYSKSFTPMQSVSVEVQNFEWLSKFFTEEQVRRHQHIPFKFVKTGNIPKEERIRRLIPYFSSGRIFVRRGLYDFESEYFTFSLKTANKHDDLLDALAYAVSAAFPPRVDKKKKVMAKSFLAQMVRSDWDRVKKKHEISDRRWRMMKAFYGWGD